MIAPPFKMDTPAEGLNSDYIKQQTQMLQLRMSHLMEEFIKREKDK